MTNHSDEPYQGKRDPRLDTVKCSHCPECGESPCACPEKETVRQDLTGNASRPTGPRITPEDIDMAIALAKDVQYHRFPYTTVTVCCVTLSNGFCVVGKSAAVSMSKFSMDTGMSVALEDVKSKLWELLGFRLKQALYEGAKP